MNIINFLDSRIQQVIKKTSITFNEIEQFYLKCKSIRKEFLDTGFNKLNNQLSKVLETLRKIINFEINFE